MLASIFQLMRHFVPAARKAQLGTADGNREGSGPLRMASAVQLSLWPELTCSQARDSGEASTGAQHAKGWG